MIDQLTLIAGIGKDFIWNEIPKNTENYIRLNVTGGIWDWWFSDKNTKQALTCRGRFELVDNNTIVYFEIPEELRGNPDAVVNVWKVRG